jgi:hypothetical protein
MLSINDITSEELCLRCEEEGNPYVRQLQDIGYEIQSLLDKGEAIDDELYVHLVTTKIRSVFHDRMPVKAPLDSAIQAEAVVTVAPQGAASGWPSENVAGEATVVADEEPPDNAATGDDPAAEGLEDLACPPELSEAVAEQDLADTTEFPPSGAEGSSRNFETCGWVLVGFPETSQRLQLLERFLSGWVAPSATPTPEAEVKKAEASLMLPRPYEEPPPFALVPGGYDMHIRLVVSNDEIIRRAVGRRLDPMTSLMYHLEDSPPCTKNQIIYERLVPVDDLTNSMGSLTNRMHAFDVAQPEVEGILSYFGPDPDAPRLRDINAEVSTEAVHDTVEEQVAMLLEQKRVAHAKMIEEEQAAAEAAAAAGDATPESTAETGAGIAEAAEGGADAKEEPSAEAAEAANGGSKEGAERADEVQIELVKMTDLPKKVQDLEDKVFRLLLQEWEELQDNYTKSIRQLFRWHRLHLSDFRRGIHGMQHRFLQFVNRVDDKQALVDGFVFRFNAFSEEYPDMRKDPLTKDELHQQADDLHEQLQQKVNARKDENMTELENITTCRWTESHIQVLAAQIQHAVRLEAQRYHAACQLLADFYHGAIGAGLPEIREPCPKIEALSPDENGIADTSRLRQLIPASEEAGTTARWEFPFVEDLMTQAQAGLFRPCEWCVPATYEKKEEVPDPKGKAKAKGKAAPAKGKDAVAEPPEKPAETPALFIDMQQALLAERVRYQYRLLVIKDWSERRLLEATETSDKLFVQLRDWVLLRRKKELDSCLDLTDVIKEHIESEDLIKAKLTLVGAHLHRHPNIHLQAEYVPEDPPPLESAVPYRFSIVQLDHLLEVVTGAARALRPGSLTVPVPSLMAVMQKLVQAPGAESSTVEQLHVPLNWRPCDVERLQCLCAILDQPPRVGTVDCIEFLLHMGLMHSPLGWPSLQTLLEVRKIIESEMPHGCSWPDFYVTEDVLAGIPLFADATGLEAELATKFPWDTATAPALFDRSREQMRWILEVFRNFQAPLRQSQAYELELAWYEHQVRSKDEVKIITKLLDDGLSGQSTPITPQVDLPSADVVPDSPAGTSEGDVLPEKVQGPPQPPRTPRNLPRPPAQGGVSVRQFLTFFCLGSSVEEGLTRSVSVLGPSPGASATTPISAVDLHAALLQLGARSTPPSLEGDGRPRHPSLAMFCEDFGLDNTQGDATMSVKDLCGHPQAARMFARYGFARRLCRAEVEKLFPKNLPAGTKITPNQRALAS